VGVQADVSGGKVTVMLNGLPVAQFADPQPLTGPLHGWCGLGGREAVFRNLRIWSPATDTGRGRQLTPPLNEKPLANGELLYELKPAGKDLWPEWRKSHPQRVTVKDGALLFVRPGGQRPEVILTRPLGPELACELEFEYPTAHHATGLSVTLAFAEKAPQSVEDCDGVWVVELPRGNGRNIAHWYGKDLEKRRKGLVIASTPYFAPVPQRKYLARLEANRDGLRVFLDGGLLLKAWRPDGVAAPALPAFIGLRQLPSSAPVASKVHAVRVYQIAAKD
jgi:hypothetical protein